MASVKGRELPGYIEQYSIYAGFDVVQSPYVPVDMVLIDTGRQILLVNNLNWTKPKGWARFKAWVHRKITQGRPPVFIPGLFE